MIKRLFDLVFSFFGLLFLSPLFFLIIVLLKINSKEDVLFKQVRVGKNNKDFLIFKFQTMKAGAALLGELTVGDRDARVTTIGYYLRKFKLDELPQLVNVFIGNMSFVGPRPEIRKYVDLYNQDQMQVLNVKPGITDRASIAFRNESEILSNQEDPNGYYINVIMPKKLQINLDYIKERSLIKDIIVIVDTFVALL